MNTMHTLYIIALLACTPLALAMDMNDDDSRPSSPPDPSLSLHNQQHQSNKLSDESWYWHSDDDDEPMRPNVKPRHSSPKAASDASDQPVVGAQPNMNAMQNFTAKLKIVDGQNPNNAAKDEISTNNPQPPAGDNNV